MCWVQRTDYPCSHSFLRIETCDGKVGSTEHWDRTSYIKEQLKNKKSHKDAVNCAGSANVAAGKDEQCRSEGMRRNSDSRVHYRDHNGATLKKL